MISLTLPQDLIGSFTCKNYPEDELFAEEISISQSFETRRMNDFIRGRYCAHQCLSHYGVSRPILKDADGSPVWPPDFTGSISHGPHLAGAILAHKKDYLSVGLDIERIGRIQHDLWPLLFTKNELRYLVSQPIATREKLSTLLFSLKEAYFKMQFPVTRKKMEFSELEIIMDKAHGVIAFHTAGILKNIQVYYHIVGEEIISYLLIRK